MTLKQFPQLTSLSIEQATDAQLELLARAFPDLENVSLGNCQASARGYEMLEKMARLRFLSLPYATISDASIPHISRLTRLQSLNIVFSRITPAGVEQFRRAVPGCQVLYDDRLPPDQASAK